MQNLRRSRESCKNEVPDVVALYELAEAAEVPVYWYSMETELESLVVETAPGETAIALDPGKLTGLGDEKYKLAHELGHSLTGALYRRNTPLDERGRCEQRADRWAIEHLLPFEALEEAVRSGRDTPAELAEYFQLPQTLVEKAVAYYLGPKGLQFQGK